MLNASLKIDIDLEVVNNILKAGDSIIVDMAKGIAHHKKSGINFDINEEEYFIDV